MRPQTSLKQYRVLLAALSFIAVTTYANDLPHHRDLSGCDAYLENGSAGKAPQSPAPARWTPSLDTLRGRIELLMSVLERHPGFVTANLSFRRNVLETFSHIPAVVKALGTDANSLEIVPPQILSARYYSSAIQYDEQKLRAFRTSREGDLESLSRVLGQDLAQTLRVLKGDKRGIKALFRILPFVFDSQGKPQHAGLAEGARQALIREHLQNSTPSDWENGYFDFLKEHIDGLIESIAQEKGMGEVRQFYQNFKSQFIEKEVRAVIRPQGMSQDEQSLRTLSIESLPASVAVARGCYGGDCSILSVPFYPLLKGVTVHFVRKSKDLRAKPDGYMVSVKVETRIEGSTKTIPYVLTVNGATLTQADVQVAVSLLLKSDAGYQTRTIAFPDWSKNPNLVNWDQSRKAMTLPRGRRAQVKLPDGWNKIVEYHNLNNRTNYTNYYGSDSIATPVVGEFLPIVQIVGDIENTRLLQPGYMRPKRIEEIPTLERAIVAAQALQDAKDSGQSSQRQLLQVLQVDQGQVQAVQPLINLSPSQGLTLAEFRNLESTFGFGLRNVLALEVKTRAKALSQLYEESPELFKEHRARDNAKIRETLIAHYGAEAFKTLLESIWDMREVTDEGLARFLKASVTTFGSNKVEDYIGLAKALNESQRSSSYVSKFLAWAYLASVNTDPSLARGLKVLFESQDSLSQNFLQEVLSQGRAHTHYQKRYPILVVYLEVTSQFGGSSNLSSSFKRWLQDPTVEATKKADFVLTLIGAGKQTFDEYLSQIKRAELEAFWNRIDQRSCFKPYYKLAQQKGLSEFVLEYATPETFLYSSDGMPSRENPKTFQMGDESYGPIHSVTLTRPIQAAMAPETDILWELVMGTNPSKFAGSPTTKAQGLTSGFRSLLGFGRSESMRMMNSSNRPVENITWWSSAVYANKKSELEGLEPVYDFSNVRWTKGKAEEGTLEGQGEVIVNLNANGYRHPTEAEQEFFVRGGTTTTYPTGEDQTKLPLVAWFDKNSGNKTHPIGELRPNALGLVDTSGNVWEWGLDWYGDYSSDPVVDPVRLTAGSYRVCRGGGWYFDARHLRSARRGYVDPVGRGGSLGARFVRPAR